MSKQTSYPKDKIKILFLENISDKAVKRFKDAGYTDVVKMSGALNEDDLIKTIKDVHLLGIRSKTHITPKVLEAASKLQAIGCFCIGTNQVDLEAAQDKGVVVFNAPYSNTRSVAELVIGLSIMLIRKIIDKNKAAHEGIWLKDSAGSHELRGKTLGIVGYGNIGSQLSVLAESMGMKVIFFDILKKLPMGNADPCKTLTDVVSQADIVSLHVPETKETEKMIDEKLLKQFKPGAIFINYARGHCVDIEALAKYLKNGHISGAAIDVFPVEPQKVGDAFSTPLQNLPNVILTPHIGGSTEEAQANIGEDVSKKLFDYLESGVTDCSLTVPALTLPPQPKAHRILHIHYNKPGVLSAINAVLSANDINILGQYLNTNNNIGYVVLDIDKTLSSQAFELLKAVKETIKIREVY